MRRRPLLLVAAALALVVPTAVAGAAADPARPQQWNLDRIGAADAWTTATGAGVVVAIIDSGVDLGHEDLAGRLVPGRDFVDDDDEPQDANGHGTHVAGIVAAAMGNGRGVAGVAPGARIMPIRVLGPDGGGSLADVVEGVRWAVAHGAHVLNLSLGEDTQAILGPAFADVLDEAWAAGVVPVVSAGNQLLTGSGFTDENVLVVAATDRNDRKPTYSSGVGAAKWGISAPGGELPTLRADNAVLSTYWTGTEPNQYAYLAGTSQAAPHVSAAVAVLLSTGRVNPIQAVQRVLATAADIGVPGRDATFGAGRVDVAAAVRGLGPVTSASAQPPPAPDPSPSSPSSTTPSGAPSPAPTTGPTITAPPTDAPDEQAVLTTTTVPELERGTTTEASPPRALVRDAPGGDGDDKALPATFAAVLAVLMAGAALAQWRHEAGI